MRLPFPLKSRGFRIEKNAIIFDVQLNPKDAKFCGELLNFLKLKRKLVIEMIERHGIKSISKFFELSLKKIQEFDEEKKK